MFFLSIYRSDIRTSVKPNVLFIVAGVEELLLAVLALVDALAAMYSQVNFEVAVVFVGFAAQIADERSLALVSGGKSE